MTVPTRERIISEALRLFAERGYRATTVGDIEAAAGLQPRRGSLYKHFKSKEEVLRAALERHTRRVAALDSVADLLPAADADAEFGLLVRWGLRELGRERELIRIVVRESDQFPEVREYRNRFAEVTYRGMAAWLRRHVESGDLPEDTDTDALSAILLGAVVNYRVEESLFGGPPLGLDEERFARALGALWAAISR
jgi:AcrR family transcriptional regulator